jgi:hypothetical protein
VRESALIEGGAAMAAIDGQFDEELALTADKKNVQATGSLRGFDDFDLTLHVVVADVNGVVAEYEKKNPPLVPDAADPGKSAWSLTVPVKDSRTLEKGTAIGYATALGTGPEGIKSWQWHSVVELTV